MAIERQTERVSFDSAKRQRRASASVVFKIPFRGVRRQVAVLHTQSHALIQPVTQPRERLIGEHRIRSAGVYALEIGESIARYDSVHVKDGGRNSETCANVRSPMGMVRILKLHVKQQRHVCESAVAETDPGRWETIARIHLIDDRSNFALRCEPIRDLIPTRHAGALTGLEPCLEPDVPGPEENAERRVTSYTPLAVAG